LVLKAAVPSVVALLGACISQFHFFRAAFGYLSKSLLVPTPALGENQKEGKLREWKGGVTSRGKERQTNLPFALSWKLNIQWKQEEEERAVREEEETNRNKKRARGRSVPYGIS
jgi:hypothetical protein